MLPPCPVTSAATTCCSVVVLFSSSVQVVLLLSIRVFVPHARAPPFFGVICVVSTCLRILILGRKLYIDVEIAEITTRSLPEMTLDNFSREEEEEDNQGSLSPLR